MPILALLALAGASPPDDRFHPGRDAATLSYGELLASGQVLGKSGAILAMGDPATLAAVAGVASVMVRPGGLVRVLPTPGTDDLALARRLHDTPGVTWAHPDLIVPVRLTGVPDDPWYADQWHLDNTGQGGRTPGVDINAPQAWEYSTGEGQLIAVLDSGVVTAHPDLRVTSGHDYIDRDDDSNPVEGADGAPHGTCVAGVAAAVGDNGYGVAGVAWDADIYAIRLIGGATTLQDIYDAFIEATDAGAAVISNSWGYYGCAGSAEYESYREMYAYAEDQGRGGLGSPVVYAAGNDGCSIDGDGLLSTKKLVVVAALQSTDERASYSNYGKWVDIAAPTDLLTTDILGGGYGDYEGDGNFVDGFSGTSAATPVVSGTFALMFAANPRLTAEQAREVICDTAVRVDLETADYDEDGWSPYYGCGRIDAGAAVAAVANTAPSAPVPRLVADTVYDGRAVLAWEAAVDPDGDVVAYEVAWTRTRDGVAEDKGEETSGTSVDIADRLKVGDSVVWQVRAWDVWGEGPWSEAVGFTVVEAPVTVIEDTAPEPAPDTGSEAPSTEDQGGSGTVDASGAGCTTAGSPGVFALVGALATQVRRRRPRSKLRR